VFLGFRRELFGGFGHVGIGLSLVGGGYGLVNGQVGGGYGLVDGQGAGGYGIVDGFVGLKGNGGGSVGGGSAGAFAPA
jgi:hypothetical protein